VCRCAGVLLPPCATFDVCACMCMCVCMYVCVCVCVCMCVCLRVCSFAWVLDVCMLPLLYYACTSLSCARAHLPSRSRYAQALDELQKVSERAERKEFTSFLDFWEDVLTVCRTLEGKNSQKSARQSVYIVHWAVICLFENHCQGLYDSESWIYDLAWKFSKVSFC